MSTRTTKILAIVVGAVGWAIIILVLIVAAGLAFLTADNKALYSAADPFAWVLIAIPIVFYFVAGFLFGRTRPELSWQWGLWITLGFFIIGVFLSASQPRYVYLIFIVLAPLVLSSLGSYLGTKFPSHRSK